MKYLLIKFFEGIDAIHWIRTSKKNSLTIDDISLRNSKIVIKIYHYNSIGKTEFTDQF